MKELCSVEIIHKIKFDLQEISCESSLLLERHVEDYLKLAYPSVILNSLGTHFSTHCIFVETKDESIIEVIQNDIIRCIKGYVQVFNEIGEKYFAMDDAEKEDYRHDMMLAYGFYHMSDWEMIIKELMQIYQKYGKYK